MTTHPLADVRAGGHTWSALGPDRLLPPPHRLVPYAVAVLFATLLGGIFALQYGSALAARGVPVAPGEAFLVQALPWYLWIAFLPIIRRIPARWPLRRTGVGRLLVVNALVGLGLGALHQWSSRMLESLLAVTPAHVAATLAEMVAQGAVGLLGYGVLVAIAYLAHDRRALHDQAVHAARLEARVANAELSALRAQLCPHFLFNTLNSACGLVTADPPRAEVMITRLSQLLRLALQTEGIEPVPLTKELDFVSAYLDVEGVRFQERLLVTLDVDPGTRAALVPNFLLQPLVENAVHHAVAPSRDPRRLEVHVRREDDRLVIEVRDDGPGLADGAMAKRRGAIGLATTRSRLEHMYGADYSLSVRNRPSGGAVAEVILPWRTAEAA